GRSFLKHDPERAHRVVLLPKDRRGASKRGLGISHKDNTAASFDNPRGCVKGMGQVFKSRLCRADRRDNGVRGLSYLNAPTGVKQTLSLAIALYGAAENVQHFVTRPHDDLH